MMSNVVCESMCKCKIGWLYNNQTAICQLCKILSNVINI